MVANWNQEIVLLLHLSRFTEDSPESKCGAGEGILLLYLNSPILCPQDLRQVSSSVGGHQRSVISGSRVVMHVMYLVLWGM